MKQGYGVYETTGFYTGCDCILVSNYHNSNMIGHYVYEIKDIVIKHDEDIGIWKLKTLKNEKTK